jgi:hypothetical protein
VTRFIKTHPRQYLYGASRAFLKYCVPASSLFETNQPRILAWDEFYNFVFYGQWVRINERRLKKSNMIRFCIQRFFHCGMLFIIGIPLLTGYWLWQSCRSLLHSSFAMTPFELTLFYLTTTILFVTIVSSCLETGENNRYRFMIDPFLWVLLALSLYKCFHFDPPLDVNSKGNEQSGDVYRREL